ncbi:MAG: STAS domain-containing protein [Thermoanaerobaculales bacterium]|nr:STAS domain-containing protein [Thermoanaerobaculales bacterium]
MLDGRAAGIQEEDTMGTLDVISTAEGRLALVGHADVHNAETFHSALTALMQGDRRSTRLNLSGLKHIDSAGIQILIAFLRLFDPGEIFVEECPKNIADTLQRLGLSRQILRA